MHLFFIKKRIIKTTLKVNNFDSSVQAVNQKTFKEMNRSKHFQNVT